MWLKDNLVMKDSLRGLLLLAICLNCSAAEVGIKQKNSSSSLTSVASQKADLVESRNEEIEIALLKEQVKQAKDYKESLLSTVYFSLGVVIAIAVLLAGFSWFSNFKLFEKDKKTLFDEFERRAAQYRLELENIFSLRQRDFESNIFLRQDESIASLKTDTRKEIAESVAVTEKLDQRLNKLEVGDSYIKKHIAATTAEMRQIEEHIWDIKKIPTNILITQSQALRAAIEAEDTYHIENVLIRMRDTINDKILGDDARSLPAEIISSIDRGLQRAANFNSVLASEVRELLSKIPVRNPK